MAPSATLSSFTLKSVRPVLYAAPSSRWSRPPMTWRSTCLQVPATAVLCTSLLPLITAPDGRPFTTAHDTLPRTHCQALLRRPLPALPRPRLPDRARRLGQGRARRHQVVDQHDQSLGQEPSTTGHHGQRAREVLPPLPGVEPGLVGHAPPLPQYGHHPRRHPCPPQLGCRRERDPPRRIMPPSPNRPPRGRHGNEQHRHTERLTRPTATDVRRGLWATGTDSQDLRSRRTATTTATATARSRSPRPS
ncbi:hypothetical protein ACIQJT_09020 [Streptomyces sp. NPDC091972]|uniref:hypothetical protein n=1 Tax=Streptomyces sp. NPDC091972 TaxID=3366007 RepID=UPI00382C157D